MTASGIQIVEFEKVAYNKFKLETSISWEGAMYKKKLFSFMVIVTAIAMATLSCSLFPSNKNEESNSDSVLVTEKAVVEQKSTDNNRGQAVSSLEDLENAVIFIEFEGSFKDPYEGWQVNASGFGSGFIIDPSGIAVTNNHVVSGASNLKVWVSGEETPRNAVVLGVSECNDLAVIDIEGDGFDYLNWYDGDIKVGMDVFAAGYPGTAAGVDFTLTDGIVSKRSTDLDTEWASVKGVIAHTAKINPGNSGGPLVTKEGKVIGVNYGSVSKTDENYAISRDVAVPVINTLKQRADYESLGINAVVVQGELEGKQVNGVWVTSVKSGSPADKARIQPGDIIVEMENHVLEEDSLTGYCDIVRSHSPSDPLNVTVIRTDSMEVYSGQINGRELEFVTTFGEGSPSGENTSTGDNNGDTDAAVINQNASESGDIYFADSFENGVDNWEYFLISGSESGFTQEARNGKFRTSIDTKDVYVYYQLKGWDFGDVQIDMIVKNIGVNTNYTGMFCRKSSVGWYEVSFLNTGEYAIYYFDQLNNSGYNLLQTGGSTLINTGKSENHYTLICQGEELTIGINGQVVKTIPLNTSIYNFLESGQVGITVASTSVLPVIVDIDDVVISVP